MSGRTTRSRREVMVMLGAGALGGCTALESNSDATTTTRKQDTQGPTQSSSTAQSTTTQTGSSGGDGDGSGSGTPADGGTSIDGVPADRLFRSTALRSDYLEAALTGAVTVPSIRYLQPYTRKLEQMRPERGRFLMLSVTLANQKDGGSWIDLPPRSDFQAWAAGSAFESLESLYEVGNVQVTPGMVRMPLDAPFSREDISLQYAGGQLQGGKQTSFSLLYDVPVSDAYLLKWTAERQIEGSDQPAYLGLEPDA